MVVCVDVMMRLANVTLACKQLCVRQPVVPQVNVISTVLVLNLGQRLVEYVHGLPVHQFFQQLTHTASNTTTCGSDYM